MMKKLLLLSAYFLVLSTTAKSQTIQPVGVPFEVNDVLHYYFNKFYFQTGIANSKDYPYYKSGVSTTTTTSHVGSYFENKDVLTVTGLEALAAKHPNTSQQTIKVHLYLCNVDGNGLPTLPPIDSVICTVGSSTLVNTIGGNFATPRTINGNFAVCMRNMSTIAGDTVRFIRTAGRTFTAYPNPWQEKYSDGYGFARLGGVFRSTTNYTANGFGMGTAYEFCVAPRVTYTMTVSQAMPQEVIDGQMLCTSTPHTFTNTSSFHITHRMYNLIEFVRKWNRPLAPFIASPTGGWPADSAVSWKFDNEDNPVNGGVIFLPYGGTPNTIKFQTDSVVYPYCTDQNFFRASHKGMAMFGASTQTNLTQNFTVCVVYCNGDTVGLKSVNGYEHVKVYPNPTSLGKATVSGLTGKNTLMVYDMLGQLVSTETSDKEMVTIDISKQVNGNYILRIVGDNNRSRVVKLVKKTE